VEKELFTLGFLSQQFQLSPGIIEAELAKAGHAPELTINHIAHWGGNATRHLREKTLADLEDFIQQQKGNKR
jgi:hypothetical protein